MGDVLRQTSVPARQVTKERSVTKQYVFPLVETEVSVLNQMFALAKMDTQVLVAKQPYVTGHVCTADDV